MSERIRPCSENTPGAIIGKNGQYFLIEKPVEESTLRQDLTALKSGGIVTSLAIVLMHSYAIDSHEHVVAKIAREVGFDQISLSS